MPCSEELFYQLLLFDFGNFGEVRFTVRVPALVELFLPTVYQTASTYTCCLCVNHRTPSPSMTLHSWA